MVFDKITTFDVILHNTGSIDFMVFKVRPCLECTMTSTVLTVVEVRDFYCHSLIN